MKTKQNMETKQNYEKIEAWRKEFCLQTSEKVRDLLYQFNFEDPWRSDTDVREGLFKGRPVKTIEDALLMEEAFERLQEALNGKEKANMSESVAA